VHTAQEELCIRRNTSPGWDQNPSSSPPSLCLPEDADPHPSDIPSSDPLIYTSDPIPSDGHSTSPDAQFHPASKNIRGSIKIATLNIRGGGSNTTDNKWENLHQVMRERKIAVLAVEETHLTQEKVASLNSLFEQHFTLHNSSDPDTPRAKGVAFILSKKLTMWKKATTQVIIPGRALFLSLPWKSDKTLQLLAIYAPNSPTDNTLFWKSLKQIWKSGKLPRVQIMLGDFNLVGRRQHGQNTPPPTVRISLQGNE